MNNSHPSNDGGVPRLPTALIFVWNNPPLIESCLQLARTLVQLDYVPVIVTLDVQNDDLIAAAGFRHESIYRSMSIVGPDLERTLKDLAVMTTNGIELRGINVNQACAYERLALEKGFPAFETKSEQELLSKTIMCIEGWRLLLDRYHPSACFVWNGLVLPSLGLKWLCGERGIPCGSLERGLLPGMLVVDGIGINYGGSLGGERWKRFDGNLPPVDPALADDYIRLYIESGRSVVNKGVDAAPEELKSHLGISPECKPIVVPLQIDFDTNILYFSPHYPTNESVIREVAEAARQLENAYVVVKAHPENPGQDLARIRKLLEGVGTITDEFTVQSLLKAAHAVVVRNSTVGLEALMHHKPVVALAQSAWSGKGFSYDVGGKGEIVGILKTFWEESKPGLRNNELFKHYLARLIEGYHYRLIGGVVNDDYNQRLVSRIIAAGVPARAELRPKLQPPILPEDEYEGIPAPTFSVIISTYNRPELVGRAIQSALAQAYDHFEVLVVEDGSPNNAADVVKAFNDPRLRYIWKENSGAPETINRGIAEATGDFVIQLDDDDEMLPGALATYGALARKRPEADVIFGELEYLENGQISRDLKYPNFDGKVPLSRVVMGCPLPHGGTAIKRDVFSRYGKFDPAFKRAYDYEWWSRVIQNLHVLYSGAFVYRWHIHSESLTAYTTKDFTAVDTSYEAEIVRRLVAKYSWQELFPELDWKGNPRQAQGTAMLSVGTAFNQWRAREEAEALIERSRVYSPSAQAYRLLAEFAVERGELREAIGLIRCAIACSPVDPHLQSRYAALIDRLHQTEAEVMPAPRPTGRKYVNITVVTHNRLAFTRRCIASLNRNTFFPHTITVVDNGSSDGTQEFLRGMHDKGFIHNLILHEENKGVAIAANDGWEAEDSDYYMKLDNDIVIEKPGWLTAMAELVDRVPKIGAVGYNFEPTSYQLAAINGFTIRLKPEGGTLGGCCVMLPRRTHEKLGFWAEIFGRYGEEDGDYGTRIYHAGLINAYMSDENIGLHLPDGRAARIDSDLNIHSSEETKYREFKEDQRRKSIDLRLSRATAFAKGELPLYQPRS